MIVGRQSRDFDSTLAHEWSHFVANGLTQVPPFVRPPSARLYQPPDECIACSEHQPHLVCSCGHALFCAKCLDTYLRGPSGRICPVCRQ